MRLLGYQKKSRFYLKILCLTAILLSLSSCAPVSSLFPFSQKSTAETQLSAELYNSFSRGWFDKCNTLQKIAEMATDADSGTSADYMLGYLRGSASACNDHFLQSIYSNQTALEKSLISEEVKQSLNTYTSAESDYLEQLGKRLKTDGRIPQGEAFQSNTKKLAKLIPYLNISAGDFRKEKETKTFQENLEKAAKLMEAAFPQENSAETFAPSDNLILLPVS